MTENKFFVGSRGAHVVIQFPPRGPITREEALNLAAWLVAVADRDDAFPRLLAEVLDT